MPVDQVEARILERQLLGLGGHRLHIHAQALRGQLERLEHAR